MTYRLTDTEFLPLNWDDGVWLVFARLNCDFCDVVIEGEHPEVAINAGGVGWTAMSGRHECPDCHRRAFYAAIQ